MLRVFHTHYTPAQLPSVISPPLDMQTSSLCTALEPQMIHLRAFELSLN
jgi:hypothetical protein